MKIKILVLVKVNNIAVDIYILNNPRQMNKVKSKEMIYYINQQINIKRLYWKYIFFKQKICRLVFFC